MSRFSLLSLALASLAVTACGTISVDVAVLDPAVLFRAEETTAALEAETLVRQELPRILALTSKDVERVVDKVAQEHSDFYGHAGRTLEAAGVDSAAPKLQDEFAQGIGPYYDDAKKDLARRLASIRQLQADRRAANDEVTRLYLTEQLVSELRSWAGLISNLEATAQRDITALKEHVARFARNPTQNRHLEEETGQSIAVHSRELSRLSTATLDADPMVSAVAGAGDTDWKRRFHRIVGRGILGNSSVAIKMEKGPSETTFPEFTLKGLTFDPSDVARMASRVTSQALALGAQMAGVSITGFTGTGTPPAGSAIAAVSPIAATKRAEVAEDQRASRTHEAALQSLALAILQSWSDLTSQDAQSRQMAVAALRTTHTALLPNLRAPSSAQASDDEADGSVDDAGEEDVAEDTGEGEADGDDSNQGAVDDATGDDDASENPDEDEPEEKSDSPSI